MSETPRLPDAPPAAAEKDLPPRLTQVAFSHLPRGGRDPGQAVGVLLREATPSDLSELLEVQRGGAVLALGDVFPQGAYPFPVEEIRARWVAELADPDIDAYVIVDGDTGVVGFAATRGSELLHFGTAVETWGTGLAARALAEIIEAIPCAQQNRR